MWIKNYVDVSTSRARASPKTEGRLNKNYVDDWCSVQNIDLLNKNKCPGFWVFPCLIFPGFAGSGRSQGENKNYVDDKNYVESVDQFRETLHENRGSVQ